MDEEKVNRIGNLRDKLYSRLRDGKIETKRRSFNETDLGIDETWKPALDVEEHETKHKIPLIKIFLIVSVVFFAGAVMLSSFFLFCIPSISPNNV